MHTARLLTVGGGGQCPWVCVSRGMCVWVCVYRVGVSSCVCVCVCVCVSRGVYTPRPRGIPPDPEAYTPPVNKMTDRQVYKHYLPATSFAGGKDSVFLTNSQVVAEWNYIRFPVMLDEVTWCHWHSLIVKHILGYSSIVIQKNKH